MTKRDDPKMVLRELIEAEWSIGSYTTPDISTGWHNQGVTVPQVTTGPDQRGGATRGNTGYTGQKGDGSGPTARTQAPVLVNCWADADEVASDENPKTVAHEYAQEVWDIVFTHGHDIASYSFPAEASVTADNYEYLAPAGEPNFRPDETEDPVNFRYEITVNYGVLHVP